MKDMKEPIEYYSPTGHISDADNNYISAIRGWGRLVVTSKDEQEATERQDAIAQRIVTCVNACAGMENPEKEIEQLEADKAELIDALEELIKAVEIELHYPEMFRGRFDMVKFKQLLDKHREVKG